MQELKPENEIFRLCIHELESFKKWIATRVVPDDYPYFLKEEDIREFMKIPLIQKIQWLEEAQEYLYYSLVREDWEQIKKFHRGKI